MCSKLIEWAFLLVRKTFNKNTKMSRCSNEIEEEVSIH